MSTGHLSLCHPLGENRFFPPNPLIRIPIFNRDASKYIQNCLGLSGTPGAIRTHDLRIRSPTLYPAELRAQNCFAIFNLGNLRFPLLASLDKLGTVDPLLLRGLSLNPLLIIYDVSSRLTSGLLSPSPKRLSHESTLNYLSASSRLSSGLSTPSS